MVCREARRLAATAADPGGKIGAGGRSGAVSGATETEEQRRRRLAETEENRKREEAEKKRLEEEAKRKLEEEKLKRQSCEHRIFQFIIPTQYTLNIKGARLLLK